VAGYDVVIQRLSGKSVPHAIVSHDGERKTLEVGKEEVISRAVPRSVADMESNCV